MHVHLQFKSFYRLNELSMTKYTNKKQKNTSKNLLSFLLLFLFGRIVKKTKKLQKSIDEKISISFFYLPVKKKSVIFLRAPYKNKLARLNILRLEFTLIISLKIKNKKYVSYGSTLSQLNSCVFSTHKSKHIKTKIKYNSVQKNNFKLKNFN